MRSRELLWQPSQREFKFGSWRTAVVCWPFLFAPLRILLLGHENLKCWPYDSGRSVACEPRGRFSPRWWFSVHLNHAHPPTSLRSPCVYSALSFWGRAGANPMWRSLHAWWPFTGGEMNSSIKFLLSSPGGCTDPNCELEHSVFKDPVWPLDNSILRS